MHKHKPTDLWGPVSEPPPPMISTKIWNAQRVRSQTGDYQCVLTGSCPIRPNATHQITQGPIPILSSGVNFGGVDGNHCRKFFPPLKICGKKNPSFPSPHSHENSLLIGSLKGDRNELCPVCFKMIFAAGPVANT